MEDKDREKRQRELPPSNGGTANGDPGKQGETGKPEERPERKSWQYTPEPDRPLNPHSFSARMQSLSNFRTPKVFISPEAYKRMQLYIELARKEVGWLGTCVRLESGDFLIDQTFLLEQEVTPTETELSVEGQNKLVNELLQDGSDEGLELVNRLRFWGHSHVRMGTSPSGTDERTMERWQSEGLPWAVRGIFNKLGRAEFTVYLYEEGYRICDAPWAVMDPQTRRIILQQRYGYGYGSGRSSYEDNRPWYASRQNSQSTIFGGTQYGSYRPTEPQFKLPPELQPSDELRNEVTADFAAKVSERLLIRMGWFDRNRDDQWSQQYGDGAPVDTTNGAQGQAQADDRTPLAEKHGASTKPRKLAPYESGGGFWSWVKWLFSTDPNEVQNNGSHGSNGPSNPTRPPQSGDGSRPSDRNDTQ